MSSRVVSPAHYSVQLRTTRPVELVRAAYGPPGTEGGGNLNSMSPVVGPRSRSRGGNPGRGGYLTAGPINVEARSGFQLRVEARLANWPAGFCMNKTLFPVVDFQVPTPYRPGAKRTVIWTIHCGYHISWPREWLAGGRPGLMGPYLAK